MEPASSGVDLVVVAGFVFMAVNTGLTVWALVAARSKGLLERVAALEIAESERTGADKAASGEPERLRQVELVVAEVKGLIKRLLHEIEVDDD